MLLPVLVLVLCVSFTQYTDEEVEHCYEEFYEDVHTEFLKFGEIVNFKVSIYYSLLAAEYSCSLFIILVLCSALLY